MKYIIPLLFGIIFSQTLYQGPTSFSYSGTENGIFSSALDDTTNLGGALNITMNDSSSFMIMGISPQGENNFDLFVTILKDSIFPIQPRTWNWDLSVLDLLALVDNPLSLPNLAIFIPGLDSTFANQWLSFFTDTTNVNDSLAFDSLTTSFFENLIDDMYIGLAGQISVEQITNQNISGTFSCTMLKPILSFPLITIDIDSGEFYYEPIELENLSITEDVKVPNTVTLHPAYPNPFNPISNINYSVDVGQIINVSIFDLNGRLIHTLVNDYHSPGNYIRNFSGHNLSSGIYFISLNNNYTIQTKKIILTK